MPKKYWVIDDHKADLPRIVTGRKSVVEHFNDIIAGPFFTYESAKTAKEAFEKRCVEHMDALVAEIERLQLGVDPWGE